MVPIPVVLAVTAAVVGVLFATLSFTLASAPGWGHLRWFALIALSAGLFCLFDGATTLGLSAGAVTWASQITIALGGVHGIGWLMYRPARHGRPPRLDLALSTVAAIFAVLALVPGVLVSPVVERHEWRGITYDDSAPTPLGVACYVYYYVALCVPLVRHARSWRREPGAKVHALALGTLILAAVNDGLVAGGVVRGPYLLEAAFFTVVLGVGVAIAQRFIAGARELDALSARLEQTVDARTRELGETQEALLRAEKLAAIGQLAAGVAHEINNPAGAVVGNLSYLLERSRRGHVPDDANECLDESLAAMQRITRITRQLLDAGRVAAKDAHTSRPVDVAAAARKALGIARANIPPHVTVSVDVPSGLFAVGDAQHLEQVIVNLVLNSAHAIPRERAGHVRISAERSNDRVRIEVADDGAGIPADVQHRIFEPFFTTKELGQGSGLGLAVSLGLVRALGGNISLVESSSAGTRMAVDLAASAPPVTVRPPAERASERPRRRLLVVDDEPAVRRALKRALADRFSVETAASVADALELLRRGEFDDVLCDVMMPDGGGVRLHAELASSRSELAERMVFITGASSHRAAEELGVEPARVLTKPLDVRALCALLDGAPSSSSMPAVASVSPAARPAR